MCCQLCMREERLGDVRVPFQPSFCDSGKTFEEASPAPMQWLVLCLGSGWCWKRFGQHELCLFPNVTALHIPVAGLGMPSVGAPQARAAQGTGGSRMLGLCAGKGRWWCWGRGWCQGGNGDLGQRQPSFCWHLSSRCSAQLPCRLLVVAGTFPNPGAAGTLSTLVGWKESGSCREGAFSSDTEQGSAGSGED